MLVGAFVASVQFVVRKSVEAMKSIEHRLLRCPTSQHLQHCHACYNALLLCCLTARRGPYGLTVFIFVNLQRVFPGKRNRQLVQYINTRESAFGPSSGVVDLSAVQQSISLLL